MPLTKIQSLGITDGTIVNADINASAAIAGTKLSGAGKVLQVVTATDTTARSTSSSSFVTGSNTLSVSITPSSASNKIFVAVSSPIEGGGGAWSFYYTIYRDSTDLGNSTNGMQRLYTSLYVPMAMSILDSPSTTSATTYQVYMRSNGGTANLNSGGAKGTITAFEIAG
jgi:hypothetical protein